MIKGEPKRQEMYLWVCALSEDSGPEVIKLFSCSTQLNMKFSLLINIKMPTIVGIFIFISREKNHAQLYLARKSLQLLVIGIYKQDNFHAQLSLA